MAFTTILYGIIIRPLLLLYEVIFTLALRIMDNNGFAIVILSLAVNTLSLPLYRRADAIQREEREIQKKMEYRVARIRKTFRGDERFMILSEYYRQNHYHPLYVLRSSIPLLLQIPFFIAAFRFLSGLKRLQGGSFWIFENLGAPDQLLTLPGIGAVNVLPILMTLINFVSATIYMEGMHFRDRLQVYGVACVFLLLLYRSPCGLVFYWTLNNVYSLCKNIVFHFLSKKKTARDGKKPSHAVMEKTLRYQDLDKDGFAVYLLSGLLLTAAVGFLIPSALISSSPQEFAFMNGEFADPLRLVFRAALLSCGFFLVWVSVFYFLTGKKIRSRITTGMYLLSGAALLNFMLFGRNLGLISSSLIYDEDPAFGPVSILGNLLVLAAAVAALWLLRKKLPRLIPMFLTVLLIGTAGLFAVNAWKIETSVRKLSYSEARSDYAESVASIPLSRNGKNVVVFMLDRFIGEYLPYILNERPELKEQFAGFTFYPNTISFGTHTNTGSPAIFGGYEYTPAEINRRADQTLEEKQNEALKVLPVLFLENDYKVTVCDPPYAGYQEIPDLSIYDDYPEIRRYITRGKFTSQLTNVYFDPVVRARDLFLYSLMKASPEFLQTFLYDGGNYLKTEHIRSDYQEFLESYSVLTNLPYMTETEEEGNTFLMIDNITPHAACELQTPDYTPETPANNWQFEKEHADRFNLNGRLMKNEGEADRLRQYYCTAAAAIKVGEWLDFLRSEGVYDNTRIIFVADHGYDLPQFEDMIMSFGEEETLNVLALNPLLLVKDFGDAGTAGSGSAGEDLVIPDQTDLSPVAVSKEFMTNADVPSMAVEGLIGNPVNPFTGKTLDQSEKTAHDQYVCDSPNFRIEKNHGNTFLDDGVKWYSVHDNIYDNSCWEKLPGQPGN